MEKFLIYGYNRTSPQEPGCTGFPGREISCITVDYRTEGVLAVLEVTFFCYSRTENVCVCIARDRNERETCSWWSSLLDLTRLLHEIFQINIKFVRGLELASGDPFMREFIQALRFNQVPTLKRICKEYAYVYGKFKLCNLNSLPTESFKETLLDFPTAPGFLSGCCLSRKFRNMVYHTIFGRQTQPYRLFLPITEQGGAFSSHLVTFCNPSARKISLCQDLSICPIGLDKILVSLRPDLDVVVFYFISWTGRTQSAMKLDKYCFQNESGHRMIVCIGKLANEYNITLELMPGQQLYWLNYMFQDVRGRGCNPLTIKLIYLLLRMVNWRPTSPLSLELVALKAVCQYRHIVDRTADMRKYGYRTVGDWSQDLDHNRLPIVEDKLFDIFQVHGVTITSYPIHNRQNSHIWIGTMPNTNNLFQLATNF